MRWAKAPTVHFVLLGGLLFVAFGREGADRDTSLRPELRVSERQVQAALQDFEGRRGRGATPEEAATIRQAVVDREVLVRYGLEQGLAEQPTVRRRLAQIAAFVAEDASAEDRKAEDGSAEDGGTRDAAPPAELARQAMELGLHRQDVVVRRILEDGARRLIRGAVLAREPSEEALEAFRRRHEEAFLEPEVWALRIVSAEAGGRGEEEILPPLLGRDLERRFGRSLVDLLRSVPTGEWLGPLPSRDGEIRVRVEARRGGKPAPLDEVLDEVRAALRQDLADRWLEERLKQLRGRYEIVLEGAPREGGGVDGETWAAEPPGPGPRRS